MNFHDNAVHARTGHQSQSLKSANGSSLLSGITSFAGSLIACFTPAFLNPLTKILVCYEGSNTWKQLHASHLELHGVLMTESLVSTLTFLGSIP